MVIVNGRGKIVLVNSRTEQLFGYQRHERLGYSVEVLLPERFHGRHTRHRLEYVKDPRQRGMGAGLELFVETSTTGQTGTCFTITLPSPKAETAPSRDYGDKLA